MLEDYYGNWVDIESSIETPLNSVNSLDSSYYSNYLNNSKLINQNTSEFVIFFFLVYFVSSVYLFNFFGFFNFLRFYFLFTIFLYFY